MSWFRLVALSVMLSAASAHADEAEPVDSELSARLDQGVDAYVAVALERSPAVRAAFDRWEASVHSIARARAFPEPSLSIAAFAQSVETRVGPQQARLSLQQAFPWPTSLTAGVDAASLEARAAQQRLEAIALAVTRQVVNAYWNVWELRAAHEIHHAHLVVLQGLSATTRARLEVDRATLADLQQVDLAYARMSDGILSLHEQETGAMAQLRAVLAIPHTAAMTLSGTPPPPALPAESFEDLAAAARAHPSVQSLAFRSEAADATARVAGARRAPSFTLGVDWTITGESSMPNVADSGKDAVMVGLGIKLPLWQGTYGHEIAAARATANALRADELSLTDRAVGELSRSLAMVRDSARRVRITEGTLLPQAEAAYDSLLGGYATGSSTLAQVLLAQKELLELRIDVDRARADHARAWAALEEACGRPIERSLPPSPPTEHAP